MKKITAIAAAVILFAIGGCNRKSVSACDNCQAGSDTFIVKLKQKANVFNCCVDQFSLTFDSVSEDSRCPLGVECIWGGTAIIDMHIGNNGDVIKLQLGFSKNLSLPNQNISAKLIELNPYPIFNRPFDKSAYEAKIVVTRQ